LLVSALVHTLGVLVLLVTAGGVLWRLYVRVHGAGPVDADFVLALLAWFLGGLVAGGVLLAAAALLRYACAILRVVDRIERVQARQEDGEIESLAVGPADERRRTSSAADSSGAESGRPGGRTRLSDVLSAIQELRDLAVVPAEQRDQLGQRFVAVQRQRIMARVSDALGDRRLRAAREHLEDGVARFGASGEFDDLRAQIATVAEATEPLAYARAVRRIEEAIADGAWAAAEQTAKALVAEYPDAKRSVQLLVATRRGRRYAAVQQYTTEHRWSEAVAAAEEFLAAYPESPEAQTLNVEIQTLRENAEIQRRKQYESQITEHLRARRFADALRLARHVIETFPGSPQARVLRRQIPVLERRVGG
jgi:hypothetical protein